MAEADAFGTKESEFAGQFHSRGATGEPAGGEVGGDDPVARHFRSKGIGAEGLADGPWCLAPNAVPESGVGDDSAGGNKSQSIIHPLGKRRNRRGGRRVSALSCGWSSSGHQPARGRSGPVRT